MMIAGAELFKKLVTASGLSPVFAERSFERLLTRAGFSSLPAASKRGARNTTSKACHWPGPREAFTSGGYCP